MVFTRSQEEEKRKEKERIGVTDDLNLNANSLIVMKNKYLAKGRVKSYFVFF